LTINSVNYSFRKHEVGDETARDGCQVRLENDILYSSKDTFCYKNFFKSVINRKEPEPLFIISDPAPGGKLISAPRLWLHNTVFISGPL
jgi:hypothetical protein